VFGISSGEFVVLLVVAAVVLGPERLPRYAQQLARLIRELRRMAQGATEQVRAELGPEFDEVDWRKLDPRQYDPRRIVREALSESLDPDDPLGLTAWKNDTPLWKNDTPLWKDDKPLGKDDKPVSHGGPGGLPAPGGGGSSGHSPTDVPFDPDAT
jgi:sec-independent protein translocase protein TatB